MAKYGDKDGVKNYSMAPSIHDRMGVGMLLCKVEFWAHQYDFSFQFWGVGNNNVFINKENIDLSSSGGFQTVKEMFEWVVKWCEKSNPRVKYPEAIIGKEISLPD
jgi:hypothetical protein